jgi:hypothetical protein
MVVELCEEEVYGEEFVNRAEGVWERLMEGRKERKKDA